MNKIREYGINLIVIYIVVIIISLILKDDLQTFAARLITTGFFVFPILMVIKG